MFRFWPSLQDGSEAEQRSGLAQVFSIIYSLPLVLVGFYQLVATTDLAILRTDGWMLLLIGGLMILFSHITYYMIIEINPGRLANTEGSLDGMLFWSAVFIYGPTALWLVVVREVYYLIRRMRTAGDALRRWAVVRVGLLTLAATLLSTYLALQVYHGLGGHLPIQDLGLTHILPAFIAILVDFILFTFIYSGYLGFILLSQNQVSGKASFRSLLTFVFQAMGYPYLSYPFGILAAGIYIQNSAYSYLFYVTGLLLVAVIARKMSSIAENSRQQTQQLEKLENLSRAIINGLPDASELPGILAEFVPVMFPSSRAAIWLGEDDWLLLHPPEWSPNAVDVWSWLKEREAPQAILSGEPLPWRTGEAAANSIVITPILAVEGHKPIGGIYIELMTLVQSWSEDMVMRLFPAVQSLAGQIASALHQADVYEERLELQRDSQELQLAGQIQASFFPDEIPQIEGWELAVTILPARETSGDFFDFIQLDDGRLGILVADVTDKGMGPALYMALSRTLIRTYAMEYEADPDVVFFAVNERILKDARANLFVTAFYGVLNPETREFVYCNAGHNPPYMLRRSTEGVEALPATGLPIGFSEGVVWENASITFEPGDALLMYTDGIPDAINAAGDYFEDEKMLAAAQENLEAPAYEVQARIIDAVTAFSEDAYQVDDITLLVISCK